MKTPQYVHRLFAAALAATLFGCGGGDDAVVPASTLDTAPAPASSSIDINDPKHITAVGAPTGELQTHRVGPQGGRIASPDGTLVVDVPTDALSAATDITMQPIENHAHGGIGPAWRLKLPDGVQFAVPVTLSFTFSEEALDGVDLAALAIGRQLPDGRWAAFDDDSPEFSRDDASRTVRVRTQQFSDWSAIVGWQIRPARASVRVGGSVPLSLKLCERVAGGSGSGTASANRMVALCENPELASIAPRGGFRTWSVNGITGGNASLGMISGSIDAVVYRAPATKPSPATVTVSVEIPWGNRREKVLSLANIRVTSGYSGTVDIKAQRGGQVIELRSTVEWTEKPGEPNTYTPTGTFSARQGGHCKGSSTVALGANDGFLKVEPANGNAPAKYIGFGTGFVNLTIVCPPPNAATITIAQLPWFLTSLSASDLRDVGPDGAIEGSISVDNQTWSWSFR